MASRWVWERFRWSIAPCAAAFLLACSQGTGPEQGGGGGHPVEVGVLALAPVDVGATVELSGRLQASRTAQVRARVAGIVERRHFVEGGDVRAGQALFDLDDSLYRATLASAQATLAKAQANLVQASARHVRYSALSQARVVSEQDRITVESARDQAVADVALARAAVETARIQLGYAHITAPIAGRIGRALVTEGALVGQGDATPLALIQQIDPLYVDFSDAAVPGMVGRSAPGSGQEVRVLLEDGSAYQARLLFAEAAVDPGNGQVALRAVVPNPQGVLLPGMYVRVQREREMLRGVFLLPQQAVTRSPQGDTVMVVAQDGKVSQRTVRIDRTDGQHAGQWIVREGVRAGEQVVVDGFQKLRGATVVQPVPWKAASASAPSSAPSSAPAAVTRPASSASAGG
ncbi:efflux RND transporter periplasmic adaptor subunit [Candidatus Symbiobacter mobilis]|nr:efflux RND transporter periplasmic adaptor subunit [Candidatus Symbiobacter mobilis]